jgi:hypothetical protein
VVTVNNGFDHEVAHRAIARIEQRQGWEPEDRGLFVARQDGELERARPRGGHQRQPTGSARDLEQRVGERSAQRIAIEVAAPIISRREPGTRCTRLSVASRFASNGRAQAPPSGLPASP